MDGLGGSPLASSRSSRKRKISGEEESLKKQVKTDGISETHTKLFEKPNPQLEISIGTSTDADMKAIQKWLEKQGEEDNSLNNSGYIRSYHANYSNPTRKLLVLKENSAPVAFMALDHMDDLCVVSIFQVKQDKKDLGYDAQLAKHCIKNIVASHFKLTCEPKISWIFWKKMGFTIHYSGGKTLAYYEKEKITE
ncbi:MAG: hypothetical protein V4591_11460 [Bdellovibrionota bacterium]